MSAMRTMKKKTAILSAVAGCIAFGTIAQGWLLPHWGVVRAKRTILLDAAGRKLPGLFDGLRRDPRYDLTLVSLEEHPKKRQESLLSRLLERIETVVYAQSGSDSGSACSSGCNVCTGNYYVQVDKAPCAIAGCTGSVPTVLLDTANGTATTGWLQNCTASCTCSTPSPNWYYGCGSTTCSNPAALCANDDKCPVGQYCPSGTCVAAGRRLLPQ
jgi:hypothetical protein